MTLAKRLDDTPHPAKLTAKGPVAEPGAAATEAEQLKPRTAGLLKDQIWIADDFDEWPQDILESFEKPLW